MTVLTTVNGRSYQQFSKARGPNLCLVDGTASHFATAREMRGSVFGTATTAF